MFMKQRMKHTKKQQSRGSVMVYGLIIMLSVSIIVTSMIMFVSKQTKYSLDSSSRQSAFNVAESGINYYKWYLSHKTSGKTVAQIADFWQNGNPYGVSAPYEAEYFDPEGGAVGKYRIEVTPPSASSTIIVVRSTGWTYKSPDATRVIEVRFRKPAWSEYALLGNEQQYILPSTNVNGKIFVNNGVRFDGVAHNTVSAGVATYYDTTASATKPGAWSSWANDYNTTQSANVFDAGKQYPKTAVDFTGVTANLSAIKTTAKSSGINNNCSASNCYFDNTKAGWHIILKADGTFDIRNVKTFSNPGVGNIGNSTSEITAYQGNWATYTIPDNGAIFVENNVWIEGTLSNKKLSIVSANLISAAKYNTYIQNSITYAHNDGSEILGIIAQNDIEITKNSANNLVINAALLSQTGRVGRSNYGNSKSSITILGAIATNSKFGFSYADGTGYASNTLTYDNNLLYAPPPYFPTGTQYVMDLWKEL